VTRSDASALAAPDHDQAVTRARAAAGEVSMNRKLALLAPLLAVAAFAVVPAAAQAVPHWYKKNVLVGSAPVSVATGGALTFEALGNTIKCKVKDTEEIWNPASGGPGQDLVTAFTATGCKNKSTTPVCPKGPVELLAIGLPWLSHLFTTPPPGSVIRDEIEKIRLQLRCIPGAVGDEFEGSLTPEVGNGKLIFGGPGGGQLLDSSSNPMTVTGIDKLIAPPGKVTAKDP
jgi:hypothetical protein